MVPRFATLGRIPKGVWVLGGVSLLMDVSSEMIHSLLPLFMATTLGASVIIIGLIEGLAEATALILKVFSGAISDYVGKRKGLALLGYGLGALSKPLFAIAPTACGEVIVYAWMERRRENSGKPYGTRLRAGLAVSARLVGK